MSHPFDFLVFIGRFQPFHAGHLAVVQSGLQQAGRVIVLCGSARQPRTGWNPFRWQEREAMIRACLAPAEQDRVLVAPLLDATYNENVWLRDVQATVQSLVAVHWQGMQLPRIGLIGCAQQQSGYYPQRFPQWEAVDVGPVAEVNGTAIRTRLFDGAPPVSLGAALPQPVQQWLAEFAGRADWQELQAELRFIAGYRQGWANAPYEPYFVTVDALVVMSGHLLLIERKARPGMGLLALPGGFVDPKEPVLDACLRELHEETCIQVPLPVLRGAIRQTRVFDAPFRAARGRTITHAFHFELEPGQALPLVEGGDDARTAQWVPLADLDPERLFEDHGAIIQALLGL